MQILSNRLEMASLGTSSNTAATRDSSLLAALKRKDNVAITEIMRRYESPLLGYLNNYLGDNELAKDIAQDTFIKLIKHPPLRAKNDTLKPWLFRVARNLALDCIRKRKKLVELDSVTDLLSDEKVPIALQSEAKHLMRSLPQELRDVVLLRIYGDLKFKEIAKQLSIPLGTALWRMNEALKRLRQQLTDHDS